MWAAVRQAGTSASRTLHLSSAYTTSCISVSNVEGAKSRTISTVRRAYCWLSRQHRVRRAQRSGLWKSLMELGRRKARHLCGALVGYISAHGDMTTAIALRTALVERRTRVHVRAGPGSLLDSTPEYEWAETKQKSGPPFFRARNKKRGPRLIGTKNTLPPAG